MFGRYGWGTKKKQPRKRQTTVVTLYCQQTGDKAVFPPSLTEIFHIVIRLAANAAASFLLVSLSLPGASGSSITIVDGFSAGEDDNDEEEAVDDGLI